MEIITEGITWSGGINCTLEIDRESESVSGHWGWGTLIIREITLWLMKREETADCSYERETRTLIDAYTETDLTVSRFNLPHLFVMCIVSSVRYVRYIIISVRYVYTCTTYFVINITCLCVYVSTHFVLRRPTYTHSYINKCTHARACWLLGKIIFLHGTALN